MSKARLIDRVAVIDGVREHPDGYLEANVRAVRTGIQRYRGAELGKPDLEFVDVYRPEAEVFNRKSLDTFSRLPVTNDHPTEMVNADNWKQYAVGGTGDEVLRDGEYLRVGLRITDAEAIAAVRAGKRELSAGYLADIHWEEGETLDGQKYQAVQKGIIANHIAIVSRGRAGSEIRIGDAANWGAAPAVLDSLKNPKLEEVSMKTITIDGIPLETTEAGAQAITTLQARLGDSAKKLEKAEADHQKALSDHAKELAKKDAEIDDLKEKVLDAAALDKRVAERADLVAQAKSIVADVKTDGVADADIRRAVVQAKFGDAAVKDRHPSYIEGRFETLVENAKASGEGDPLRKAHKDSGMPIGVADAEAAANTAWDAARKSREDAWKH